jgi:hypothetical protein
MTINIISNQVKKTKIRGPKKVLNNLLKGLDLIGVEYVLNQPMSKFKYNWIQDSNPALIEASFLNIPVLLGPNIALKLKELPYLRPQVNKNSIYLQPSKWSKMYWLDEGFNECKVEEWSVGIDTELFHHVDRSNLAKKVLVYYKQRNSHELDTCIDLLKNCGIDFSVLKYGDYNENQFMDNLKKCTLCIWIGCDESQGIGLQEILSTNMPIIVIKDSKSKFKFYDSSPAPYFDNSCGIILDKISELSEDLIKNFNPKDFTPRKYIVNTLSLEVSTKIFIDKVKRIKAKNTSRFNLKHLCFLIYLIELPFRKTTYKSIMNKFSIFLK